MTRIKCNECDNSIQIQSQYKLAKARQDVLSAPEFQRNKYISVFSMTFTLFDTTFEKK